MAGLKPALGFAEKAFESVRFAVHDWEEVMFLFELQGMEGRGPRVEFTVARKNNNDHNAKLRIFFFFSFLILGDGIAGIYGRQNLKRAEDNHVR